MHCHSGLFCILTLATLSLIPIEVFYLKKNNRLAHLQFVHDAKIMTASISVAYSSFSTTFQFMQEHQWFGCFINDTLLAVEGGSSNGCASYFEVLDNNILQPYTFDCSYL